MGKKASVLSVAAKAFDPHLEALFAGSSGPVSVPTASRYSDLRQKGSNKAKETEDDDEGDDEELSEGSQELNDDDDETGDENSDEDEEEVTEEPNASGPMDVTPNEEPRRERKRKRTADNEDLEGKYLAQLTKEETANSIAKRSKVDKDDDDKADDDDEEEEEDEDEDEEEDVDNDAPVHESLASTSKSDEADKASRTVFLANVSTDAISSKAAKKTLLNHLSSALDKDEFPIQKVESIRFRSVAFSTGAMPKRAAYITKSLMDATTKSTNAYVVFSTDAAARRVVSQLNGTEVLDRHIRVDSVAHPSPTDHRRCIFVGNLGFVDDESIVTTNSDGETERKKRNKVPSDIEEGLWRTFSKQGKVENVRVIRDPKTRVGKGFAYVQFYDANDVEAALLHNDKKFPPMLPRKLRVTRAKDPRKTAQAIEKANAKANKSLNNTSNGIYNPRKTPQQQAAAGRASRLYGKSGASQGQRGLPDGIKPPAHIVFEGRRASSRDALPKDLKGKKGKGKGKKVKPTNRGARRAAEWQKKTNTAA